VGDDAQAMSPICHKKRRPEIRIIEVSGPASPRVRFGLPCTIGLPVLVREASSAASYHFDIVALSTGHMLRAAVRRQTFVGQEVAAYLETGDLVLIGSSNN